MTLKYRSPEAEAFNAKQEAAAKKLSAGDVVDITDKLAKRKEEQKAKNREKMETMMQETMDLMAQDPGFQRAARKREAEQKMREHAAGRQLFKKGDRVVYAGDDEAIPANWRGRIVEHEWFSDHAKDPETDELVETREHNYIVKWYNPKLGQYHEGLHHQDELKAHGKTSAAVSAATRNKPEFKFYVIDNATKKIVSGHPDRMSAMEAAKAYGESGKGKAAVGNKPADPTNDDNWLPAEVSAATNLTPEQLAIMKFIRKSGKDKVTVREIEKSRFGGTPWFKAWLQKTQPKKDLLVSEDDINFADVELPAPAEPRHLADNLLRYASPVTMNWNADQSLFESNKIFALAVDERRVPELFAPLGPAAVRFLQGYNEKARMSGHPTVPNKIIIAWVRYTEMEDGTLWVHEVQTDLFWAVGARHMTRNDMQEAMQRGDAYSKEANYYIREVIKQRATAEDKQMQLLEFEVMKEFVAEHPNNRIVFPTPKYRVDNYPADLFGDKAAPASVYNEIPRKMRFEKKPVESLDLEEAPAGEVWVYASATGGQKAQSGDKMSKVYASVSRSVRALLADGSPSEVLKASTSVEVAGLVQAVATDIDMAKAVISAVDGSAAHKLGLAKLKVLADESGSEEAKKLLAASIKAAKR
jgi:hypothetical protein